MTVKEAIENLECLIATGVDPDTPLAISDLHEFIAAPVTSFAPSKLWRLVEEDRSKDLVLVTI